MSSPAELDAAPVRGRLFRRYLATIGAGIGAVLLTALLVETTLSYRDSLAQVSATQAASARSAAARTEQFMASVESILRESASLGWSLGPASAEGNAELFRLMKVVPSIDAVQLVAPDGRIVEAVSRRDLNRPPAARYEDRALLAAAAERGAAVGGVRRSGLESVVAMAVRASGADPHVIVAELNLRTVSDIVTGLEVGASGHAYLAATDGAIIAHRDPAMLLRPPPDLAQRIRELAADSSTAAHEMRGSGGGDVLASVARLPRWGWVVVVEQPRHEALAPVRATIWRLAFIIGVGILVVLLLSSVLARRLSRPIVALRAGADRIARGDLQSRIEVATGDEVELLARDFNRMAAQLEQYTAGLERKVAERTAELQAALQARALFLAAASHDLRQPLYAISLLADTLSSEPLDESSAAILAKQREAIAVLRALFDNLLDLSRFDAGEVKPVLRVVPLRDLLAPAVLETEVLCHARGLSFHSEIADAWVSTDPDLLRRVASNLLSNAVRYTPEGGVMLSSWAADGFVTVEIRDTGIGIAPEDQARVFEEFVQLGNPGRDREKGVGLGLSIVKRICDLLGTPVAMRSVPGRGTSFTLRIPLAQAPSAGAAAAVDRPAAPELLRGTRVWVVEDDPMVRDALALQLASWGVAHAFARSIAELEAHRAAEGDWPDALLVDDMLGGDESGLDIATWLKDRMEARRIVLVTGNVDAQRLEALEASGLEVLRKPLSSADLARCLAKAMGASAVSVAWADPAARPGPARAPAG